MQLRMLNFLTGSVEGPVGLTRMPATDYYIYEIPLSFAGKVVVEVGCGPGNFLRVITAKERIGIEPLFNKFEEIFDMDIPGIQFIKGKGESISLPDNKADVVFCSNVLNHTRYPEMVLKEIRRIMKPG